MEKRRRKTAYLWLFQNKSASPDGRAVQGRQCGRTGRVSDTTTQQEFVSSQTQCEHVASIHLLESTYLVQRSEPSESRVAAEAKKKKVNNNSLKLLMKLMKSTHLWSDQHWVHNTSGLILLAQWSGDEEPLSYRAYYPRLFLRNQKVNVRNTGVHWQKGRLLHSGTQLMSLLSMILHKSKVLTNFMTLRQTRWELTTQV